MDEYAAAWRWAREYLREVRPRVDHLLEPWRQQAQAIPHPILRAQALESLRWKQFHCEGGAVIASPSRDPQGLVLAFLIPYQTLCDYLDTVTDRGPSQDPDDLRLLHQALIRAVDPTSPPVDFYRLHPHQDDGGYLTHLVDACRQALVKIPGYPFIRDQVLQLAAYYVELQVLKHGPSDQRVSQLQAWHRRTEGSRPTGLLWWEFAAATGSTLGIFALIVLALDPSARERECHQLGDLYFPWMGALHILLDYYIDQQEDEAAGDLNFVACYPSPAILTRRFTDIYQTTLEHARLLPDSGFHRYVAQGLVGFYLADRKVGCHLSGVPWRLLKDGGVISLGIWLAAHRGRAP